ncbi:MAG: RNA polymerase sigma factor [Phycisphaerales bacterium]|nr:MAG: RNA polymerase sigma factor [Phycisphaerales bacterium]
MDSKAGYIELVERARQGDRQSLNELATMARERLRVYVYRLTQNQDLTQEIVQESLLEMCRVLGKLKQTDRFWSWLYGIATNKLHRHHRTEKALRNAAAAEERRRGPMKERQGGLENLVSQELKQIVSKAMQKLRTRHKAVLVMRCYDGMTYAEIADSMGCTEFSTRMLFVRAKRALQKELSRNGFGKGSLLAALIVFGKITAPSEAAAAQLTVPVAATQVGVLASLASLATTKTTLVSIAAVGAVTVGSVATTTQFTSHRQTHAVKLGGNRQIVSTLGAPTNAAGRYRYYFPEGPEGPVMLRAELGTTASGPARQFLQNSLANYAHQGSSVAINNYRIWSEDLSVMRLPTDGRTLTNFLTRIEGKASKTERVAASSKGLLVTVERAGQDDPDAGKARPLTVRHQNVLEEDYFQSDWPADARIVDNRDTMHLRGWTFFRLHGQIDGQELSGTGRIPFVYGTSRRYNPWLRLQVGEGVTLVDSSAGAMVLKPDGSTAMRYPQGSFFRGLARPWMGLHTMDLVRRDAAEQRIPFETQVLEGGHEVQVTILGDPITLVYTIDLEADLVLAIEFRRGNTSVGRLEFEYLQEVDASRDEVKSPAGLDRRVSLRESQGIGWLTQLAEGMFVK